MTEDIITAEETVVLEQETPQAVPVAEEPVQESASEAPAQPEFVTVVDIQFRSGSKVYFFDPDGLELKSGDHVIMDTARGNEFGYCVGGNHEIASKDVVQPLRKILRIATEKDEKINNDNIQKEKKAYEICQQKIQAHGLDMQLVSAECAFDGSKIIFFFTADGRVDFRELVKNLASVFRTRIELRQIGVRDKAKMVGGLGICGRPFCCKEFLDDFQPVSIKMAKTQNLSLNPTKISGTCGRLMCCLKYEQEAYEDLLKTSPKNESFVDTVDGRGTIIDVNLLRQSVRVRMEDEPDTINTYKNCDICVLRSGKGKKTDPPIPKDVAPISSKPRPAKKLVELPDEPMPDVILNGETLPAAKPEAVSEEKTGRRRRKKKPAGQSGENQAPKQEQPKQPKPEQKQKPEQKPRTDKPEQRSDKPRPPRPRSEKPRPPKQNQGEQQPKQPKQPKPERTENAPKPEGAPKAEGAANKPHRRRRKPHTGPKPTGGEVQNQ